MHYYSGSSQKQAPPMEVEITPHNWRRALKYTAIATVVAIPTTIAYWCYTYPITVEEYYENDIKYPFMKNLEQAAYFVDDLMTNIYNRFGASIPDRAHP